MTPLKHSTIPVVAAVPALLFLTAGNTATAQVSLGDPAWVSTDHFRLLLKVDPRNRKRSHSPVSLEVDFQSLIRGQSGSGQFDENTLEVFALRKRNDRANPPASQASPSRPAGAAARAPHRVDRLFGATQVTLHFVMPDSTSTQFAVYFDTRESGLGRPRRFPGLVGDGDRFLEEYKRRDVAPSHFDCFTDFDGDGDLDLFKGGVEPYVYCYENVGGNRLEERGRLTSGGKVLKLPASSSNRSWVTVAFYDLDGDGDQDFFPSFGDGPDAGSILFYRNTTRQHGGQLTFTRVGPLRTVSGTLLAGGAQAGGWFPSIAFVTNWTENGGPGPDALVGSNHRCWFYRCLGANADGSPRFTEAIPIQAGGQDIVLVNPRFDVADLDGDGDLDLVAGTQPGAVHWFENVGSRFHPVFAPGRVVAWDGKYLIGDAHAGVTIADFDGDRLPDIVSGRFWERTDLNAPEAPRVYGGFFPNVGTRSKPRFDRAIGGGPFTEQFQICDALRQNGVRTVDWNGDGKPDLLAGDTDGFVWRFRNVGQPSFPIFAAGEKLRADQRLISRATHGGHARFDVGDWDNDGLPDLIVADGQGFLTLFHNRGNPSEPALAQGQPLSAEGKPIRLRARASAALGDWDNDGRQDLVLADEKGYYVCLNLGPDATPRLAAPKPVLFGGRPVRYVRPNLGSFVDWDGDGRRDLIGCHFENSIRFYRNMGDGAPGSEPKFADPEGLVILQAESPQMISGAEAVDWNGDGDLDLLTGQGHGGSGLRYYERDWIEDELHDTHPLVTIVRLETKPKLEQ